MARNGGDRWLFAIALVSALLFAGSVRRLWPLPPVDLFTNRTHLVQRARAILSENGFATAGYDSQVQLNVLEGQLDYLEQSFGLQRTQSLLKEGLPTIHFSVAFHKQGTSDSLVVQLLPDGRPVNWLRTTREDEPGGHLSVADARVRAEQVLTRTFGLNLQEWKAVSLSSRDLETRRDHVFMYSRFLSHVPYLETRALVRVAGDRVVTAGFSVLEAPRYFEIAARREGGRRALDLIGMLLFSGVAFGGYLVFLIRLREGTVGLRRPLLWSGAVFLCTLGALFLLPQIPDPLVPPFVSWLQSIVNKLADSGWSLIALMALAAAGDAIDRKSGAGRGETLWRLTRGHIFDRAVGASAGRGFLLGFVCAGVMVLAVLALEQFGVARIALQPRGFFLVGLNAVSPSLWSLLYFLHVALLEELGYRYFAGAWLLEKTRRPVIAILLPALLYGLTHTGLTFLPPADPFWARPLVMALVGCIWGWAFLRYDALTVVISHLSADLFIFSWPQLASGNPWLVVPAVLTVGLPLLPALGLLFSGTRRVNKGEV
jgi:hypothetical protein